MTSCPECQSDDVEDTDEYDGEEEYVVCYECHECGCEWEHVTRTEVYDNITKHGDDEHDEDLTKKFMKNDKVSATTEA